MKRESLQTLAKKLMRERLMLPEAESGGFKIFHSPKETGQKLAVVTMREAIMTGLPQTDLKLTKPTVIHQLLDTDGGVLMSDLPCELVQMHRELASKAKGRVLIGGLGLGIVARMVANRPQVSQVTVVELQPDIITLVNGYLGPKVDIVQGNIHEYVNPMGKGYFDVALLDTWSGTGEWVWQTEVVPLRRKIACRIKKVYCWAEQTMLAQVAMGLYRAASMDDPGMYKSKSNCHQYAFCKGVEKMHIKTPKVDVGLGGMENWGKLIEAEQENQKNLKLRALVSSFLYTVGTSEWEWLFGEAWDEAWAVRQVQKEVTA